jgi:hypothetical protein
MYKHLSLSVIIITGIILTTGLPLRILAQEVKTHNGLTSVTFQTPDGQIQLLLPDQLAPSGLAGGSVNYIPGSDQEKKRIKQLATLRTYTIAIGDAIIKEEGRFEVKLPLTSGISVDLLDADRTTVQSGAINLTSVIHYTEFQIPGIIKKGFYEKITGPFSGTFQGTQVRLGGESANLLAVNESELFFSCPDIQPGRTEVELFTPEWYESQMVNIVDLSLEAGQTDLLPGQQTAITVTISGLQGVQQIPDLTLENTTPAIISLEGGNSQIISISSEEIAENGTWQRTFTITGRGRGDFSVTSDLIVPEQLLQAEEDPERIVDCDLNGYPVLVPVFICDELQQRISRKPIPPVELSSDVQPGFIELKGIPDSIEMSGQLTVNLTFAGSFEPHFVLFEIYRLRDSLLIETVADTTPADGLGFIHEMDSGWGLYAVRANIYHGMNQMVQAHSFFTQSYTDSDPQVTNSPEVTRVDDQIRDAQRRASGLRVRHGMLENHRRQQDSMAIVERNRAIENENQVQQLEAIDQILDTMEGLYRDRLRALIDSLGRLPAIPDTGGLRQALGRLEAALAECLAQLQRLQDEERELRERIPALEQDRLNAYHKIFDYYKQAGYAYAGHRTINAQGDLEYAYGLILRSGNKVDYYKGAVPVEIASNVWAQDRAIQALNNQLRGIRARLMELPGLMQSIQEECDRLQALVNQAREALASGKTLSAQNASLSLQRDELCREIRNLMGPLMRWCDQHPDLCTFKNQLEEFLRECPTNSAQLSLHWTHFNQILEAKRGIEERQRHQALRHRQNGRSYRDQAREAENGISEAETELSRLAGEISDLGRQRQEAARQARQRLEDEARQRAQREREEQDNCARLFAQWVAKNEKYLKKDNLKALETVTDGLETTGDIASGVAEGMAHGATMGIAVSSALASSLINLGASIFYGWIQSAATAAVKRIADEHVVDLINAQLFYDSRKCGEFDPDPPPPPSFFFFRKGNQLLVFRISASHGLEFLGERPSL